MQNACRIEIVHELAESRAELTAYVERNGHSVIQACSGVDFVGRAASVWLDLMLVDVPAASDAAFRTVAALATQHAIPIVAVSDHPDIVFAAREQCREVFAYVLTPLRERDVITANYFAVALHHGFCTQRNEIGQLRKALEDRKLIEKAKGIVMRGEALDEHSAYRRLQTTSRKHRLKMVEVARGIVLAEEARLAETRIATPQADKPL